MTFRRGGGGEKVDFAGEFGGWNRWSMFWREVPEDARRALGHRPLAVPIRIAAARGADVGYARGLPAGRWTDSGSLSCATNRRPNRVDTEMERD